MVSQKYEEKVAQRETGSSFWQRVALVSLKAVHSLLYFSIEFCMGYLIYAGLKGREDRRTAIAASVVVGESLIFLGNRRRCPLTGLAQALGDADGSVTDIYLPDVIAANLPLIHVPLLALALFLHARNFLRSVGLPGWPGPTCRWTISPGDAGPGQPGNPTERIILLQTHHQRWFSHRPLQQ